MQTVKGLVTITYDPLHVR